jgi:hypothetical protein
MAGCKGLITAIFRERKSRKSSGAELRAKRKRLTAQKIKSSLAQRIEMIHPPLAINKRKEVIRCLMVQQ